MKKLLLIYMLMILGITTSFAQTNQWRVVWDTNLESDMAYYTVFRNEASPAIAPLTTVIHIAGPDTTQYVDASIARGIQYFYRIKAVNLFDDESDFSLEVSAAIPNIIQTTYDFKNQQPSNITFATLFVDPDNIDADMIVTPSVENNVDVTVYADYIMIEPVPLTFIGTASFVIKVEDPGEFYDEQLITVNYTSRYPSTPLDVRITK